MGFKVLKMLRFCVSYYILCQFVTVIRTHVFGAWNMQNKWHCVRTCIGIWRMALCAWLRCLCIPSFGAIFPSLFVGISRQLYQNTCKAFLNDHAITPYVIYFQICKVFYKRLMHFSGLTYNTECMQTKTRDIEVIKVWIMFPISVYSLLACLRVPVRTR